MNSPEPAIHILVYLVAASSAVTALAYCLIAVFQHDYCFAALCFAAAGVAIGALSESDRALGQI